MIKVWICYYIHIKYWNMNIHPCPYLNGGLVKPLFQLGHGWVITSQRKHGDNFLSVPSSSSHFLSLAQSKLRLCSVNHRPGYWSNLPCDWPSTTWAYSKQETENVPGWPAGHLAAVGPQLWSSRALIGCMQPAPADSYYHTCTQLVSWGNFRYFLALCHPGCILVCWFGYIVDDYIILWSHL